MLTVFTAVVWLVFGAAGVAGLKLQYQMLQTAPKARPPVTVERLNLHVVKTESAGSPRMQVTPRPQVPEPAALAAPQLPSLLPVADPKLSIPFPLAVEGPSKIVEAAKAAPTSPVAATPSTVQHLTFGEGEGDQPAPEYPREAKIGHEEGNVTVQMTIDEGGNVTDAQVTSACPWPILNQAALRAVRDTWHFEKGPVRYRDVEFVFELHQR